MPCKWSRDLVGSTGAGTQILGLRGLDEQRDNSGPEADVLAISILGA